MSTRTRSLKPFNSRVFRGGQDDDATHPVFATPLAPNEAFEVSAQPQGKSDPMPGHVETFLVGPDEPTEHARCVVLWDVRRVTLDGDRVVGGWRDVPGGFVDGEGEPTAAEERDDDQDEEHEEDGGTAIGTADDALQLGLFAAGE